MRGIIFICAMVKNHVLSIYGSFLHYDRTYHVSLGLDLVSGHDPELGVFGIELNEVHLKSC